MTQESETLFVYFTKGDHMRLNLLAALGIRAAPQHPIALNREALRYEINGTAAIHLYTVLDLASQIDGRQPISLEAAVSYATTIGMSEVHGSGNVDLLVRFRSTYDRAIRDHILKARRALVDRYVTAAIHHPTFARQHTFVDTTLLSQFDADAIGDAIKAYFAITGPTTRTSANYVLAEIAASTAIETIRLRLLGNSSGGRTTRTIDLRGTLKNLRLPVPQDEETFPLYCKLAKAIMLFRAALDPFTEWSATNCQDDEFINQLNFARLGTDGLLLSKVDIESDWQQCAAIPLDAAFLCDGSADHELISRREDLVDKRGSMLTYLCRRLNFLLDKSDAIESATDQHE